MLSDAKISDYWLGEPVEGANLRLKAWPRGLRPLRCSFASLRTTSFTTRNKRAMLQRDVERNCPFTAIDDQRLF
jgi:hypothetical protein